MIFKIISRQDKKLFFLALIFQELIKKMVIINLYIAVEVLYYKESIFLSPLYLLIDGKRVPIFGCIKIELMLTVAVYIALVFLWAHLLIGSAFCKE